MRTLTGSPQVVFTLDFHQLVYGALRPGARCRILYDPLRIVDGDPYRFGDPSHPIVAHVQTLPEGAVTSVPLESPIGAPEDPDVDVTGRGSMLAGTFEVPEDCDELAFWFTYTAYDQQLRWDSAYGANYHIRFPMHDIIVREAVVTSDPQTPYSGFGVEASAVAKIDSMAVRYRVVNDPARRDDEITVAMQRGGADADDPSRVLWSVFGVAVPYRASVAFDLLYTVAGRRFKDDNSGRLFLASP